MTKKQEGLRKENKKKSGKFSLYGLRNFVRVDFVGKKVVIAAFVDN